MNIVGQSVGNRDGQSGTLGCPEKLADGSANERCMKLLQSPADAQEAAERMGAVLLNCGIGCIVVAVALAAFGFYKLKRPHHSRFMAR